MSGQDLQADIAHIPLFAALSPAARRELAAVASTRTCDDSQLIILEGSPDAPVFFVLQGTVRAFRTNLDGREQTLIHLGPGAAFNMPAAFTESGDAPASAIAVGPVRLLWIPCQDFGRLASQDHEIALAVLSDFATKLHHLTDLTYDLSLRTVRGRLAQFLLTHAQSEGATPLRWTHEEIAARLGTVREVVSRTLRAFVREGLIKTARHRIVVADPDALVREAES